MADSWSSSGTSSRPTRIAPSRAAAGRILLALAAAALALPAFPQAAAAQAGTSAPPPSAATPDPAAAEAAKRRDTIRYGIDEEILELLRKLGGEKDGSYNEDLAALLDRTRNPKLRVAILDFLGSLEWGGAEARALKLVEERDSVDSGSVTSALYYLAALRSKKALSFSKRIVEEDDKKLLPALLRLLGRAGGKEEEELLLGWFESDAATEALRQEAIRALGEIGSSKAAERLARLARDAEAKTGTRMAACAALAKIKEGSTVEALVAAANGEDPNVRAAAVEALGSFSDDSSASALVEALRDSFVKSRIAACKAIGVRRIASADSFLRYKATSDPERSVKTEALKALAELGGDSFSFLRERMSDKKLEPATRALCFGLLMRKDPPSMEALSAALAAEAAEKERSVYSAYVKELAAATDAPGAAPLARILLADKDPLMRVGAVEWARKSKARDFLPELEKLSKDDPSDMIRKRAVDALAALNRKD